MHGGSGPPKRSRREGEEGLHGDAMETAPEGAAKEKHLLIISILL